MKELLFITIFVLAFCAASFAQNNQSLSCPTISVTGHSNTPQPGDTISFTAEVQDLGIKNLIYNWTVTSGEIIEGQRTLIITVKTPREWLNNITATIEIKGLPDGCENTFSESMAISDGGDPIHLDVYEKISFSDEKARISMGVSILKEHKDLIFLFTIFYTKNDDIYALKRRITNIANYLINTHKLSKNRVKFVFDESDSYSTDIYLPPMSVGSDIPTWKESLKTLKPQNQTSKKIKRKPIKKK